MSADIKAGDMVVITRPSTCCGSEELLGTVFTVPGIDTVSGFCRVCRGYVQQQPAAQLNGGYVEVSRLKKLDAPGFDTETLDDVPVRDEVAA